MEGLPGPGWTGMPDRRRKNKEQGQTRVRSDHERGQETKGKTSSVVFGQGCHLLPPVYQEGVDYQLGIIRLSHLQNLLMRLWCGAATSTETEGAWERQFSLKAFKEEIRIIKRGRGPRGAHFSAKCLPSGPCKEPVPQCTPRGDPRSVKTPGINITQNKCV